MKKWGYILVGVLLFLILLSTVIFVMIEGGEYYSKGKISGSGNTVISILIYVALALSIFIPSILFLCLGFGKVIPNNITGASLWLFVATFVSGLFITFGLFRIASLEKLLSIALIYFVAIVYFASLVLLVVGVIVSKVGQRRDFKASVDVGIVLEYPKVGKWILFLVLGLIVLLVAGGLISFFSSAKYVDFQKDRDYDLRYRVTDESECADASKSYYENGCYKRIASAKEDCLICENVESDTSKSGCYNGCAIATENIKFCENTNNFDNCYSQIMHRIGNVSYCYERRDNDEYDWETCFIEVAKSNGDSLLCEEIPRNNTRDYCYRGIAYNSNDSSICEKIIGEDEYARDGCFSNIAENSQDAAYCSKIVNKDMSIWCEVHILKNWERCEEIEKDVYSNGCFSIWAIETGDISICDKLTDEGWIEDCRKTIEEKD